MKTTRLLSLVSIALSLAACNGPVDGGDLARRDAALAHVRTSTLQQRAEALRGQGWTVAALDDARVEWLQAPRDGAGSANVEWTRVSLDVHNNAGASAALILAWTADGAEQFATRSADRAASLALHAALSSVETSTALTPASPESSRSPEAQPLACTGIGGSCAGGGSCCSSLSCYGPDHHETCNCSNPWTSEFPQRGYFGIACFSYDDPAGEGFFMRVWRGCGWGVAQGMCNTVSVPGFTTSIHDYLECYTGSPC